MPICSSFLTIICLVKVFILLKINTRHPNHGCFIKKKIMIHYLEIEGKKYPLRISYYALKKIQAEFGISFEDMDERNMDFAVMESLLFHSMVSGCKKMKVKMPFKKEDMEGVLDDCFFDFVDIIPKAFPKQVDIQKPKKKSGEEAKPSGKK